MACSGTCRSSASVAAPWLQPRPSVRTHNSRVAIGATCRVSARMPLCTASPSFIIAKKKGLGEPDSGETVRNSSPARGGVTRDCGHARNKQESAHSPFPRRKRSPDGRAGGAILFIPVLTSLGISAQQAVAFGVCTQAIGMGVFGTMGMARMQRAG